MDIFDYLLEGTSLYDCAISDQSVSQASPGLTLFHDDPRFPIIEVVWNLGLPWNIAAAASECC